MEIQQERGLNGMETDLRTLERGGRGVAED